MITLDNFIFVVLVALFLNTLFNLKRMRPEAPGRGESNWPSVSILVPVRNEERNIRCLIGSLLKQDYPNFEIVVVDDSSSDRTWPILLALAGRHARLRIVQNQELPPGWTGKNWACHQLSRLARGELFLFTDADTVHNSQALKQAVASAHKHRSGLLSALPRLEARTWSEKLYMPMIPFAFVSLLPFFCLNSRRGPSLPAVLGPFLLIPRRVYGACGGHQAIQNHLVDDISLARQVIQHGERTTLIDGSPFLRIRFYRSFRDLWVGFSKNSYEAVRGTPLKLAGIIVACYLLFIHPYLALLHCLWGGQLFSLPLLQVAAITLSRWVLAERFRTSSWVVILHPFSVLLALLILINSFRLSLFRKKIAWKERYYPVP
ncbi:MAG: glycosyltransferase [Candidatus Aminicenantales bacterium]